MRKLGNKAPYFDFTLLIVIISPESTTVESGTYTVFLTESFLLSCLFSGLSKSEMSSSREVDLSPKASFKAESLLDEVGSILSN